MEIIRIAGYTVEEKVEIAWRYMLPRLLEEHGITDHDIQFTDEVLELLASRYSREAGLRNFERDVASIMRRRARRKAEGEQASHSPPEAKPARWESRSGRPRSGPGAAPNSSP